MRRTRRAHSEFNELFYLCNLITYYYHVTHSTTTANAILRNKLTFWQILAYNLVFYVCVGVTMLQLVDLKVPSYTIRGQPVRLECHYDLEGEALYSVKWFKDDKEFFRFYPEDDPPAQVFRVHGVLVDVSLKKTFLNGTILMNFSDVFFRLKLKVELF